MTNRRILLIQRNAPASLWDIDLDKGTPPVFAQKLPELRTAKFIQNNRILTASMANEIAVWEFLEDEAGQIISMNRIMEFVHIGEKFKDMDYCRDTGNIVTSHALNEVRMWNARGAAEPLIIARSWHNTSAKSARFSGDGKRIAVAFQGPKSSQGEKARIYRLPEPFTLENTNSTGVWDLGYLELDFASSMDFSPDSDKMLTVSNSAEEGYSLVTQWRLNNVNSNSAEPEGTQLSYAGKLLTANYNDDGTRFNRCFGCRLISCGDLGTSPEW